MPAAIDSATDKAGFTLMEIMVALAIVAVLFTSLFAVFDQSMDVAEEVKTQTAVDQNGRLILHQLSNDLDSMYLPGKEQNATFQGQSPDLEFMAENATVLEFTTSAGLDFNATFPSNALYRVSYTLSPLPELEPRRFRLLRSQALITGNGTVPETRTTLSLSKTVQNLQLEFIDPELIDPDRSWNSDDLAQETRPPPAEVRIRLSLAGPSGREQTFSMARSLRE
jgi:type II secretion system protein J